MTMPLKELLEAIQRDQRKSDRILSRHQEATLVAEAHGLGTGYLACFAAGLLRLKCMPPPTDEERRSMESFGLVRDSRVRFGLAAEDDMVV